MDNANVLLFSKRSYAVFLLFVNVHSECLTIFLRREIERATPLRTFTNSLLFFVRTCLEKSYTFIDKTQRVHLLRSHDISINARFLQCILEGGNVFLLEVSCQVVTCSLLVLVFIYSLFETSPESRVRLPSERECYKGRLLSIRMSLHLSYSLFDTSEVYTRLQPKTKMSATPTV